MWQNHHALFRQVERLDRTTVFWNLLLLGGTAFIPFATIALGRYPTMSASTFLYGLTLSTTATCVQSDARPLGPRAGLSFDRERAAIAATVRAYRTGWVVYGAATLLALRASRGQLCRLYHHRASITSCREVLTPTHDKGRVANLKRRTIQRLEAFSDIVTCFCPAEVEAEAASFART